MYVGHLAVALASIRLHRGARLWALLLAAQWPDWVQLALTGLGAYNAQLYTHSLPAIGAGALLFGLIYFRQFGDSRAALLTSAIYLTHPLLDLVTGQKALWPGGAKLGANWYDQPLKDFTLETAMVIIGWWIYQNRFRGGRHARQLRFLLASLIACQGLADVGQQLRLMRRRATADADDEASISAVPRAVGMRMYGMVATFSVVHPSRTNPLPAPPVVVEQVREGRTGVQSMSTPHTN